MLEPPHPLPPDTRMQIVYVALLCVSIGLVFLGFQVAQSGLDALYCEYKVKGALQLIGGWFLVVGSAFLPWGGYWLLFEGGLIGILG